MLYIVPELGLMPLCMKKNPCNVIANVRQDMKPSFTILIQTGTGSLRPFCERIVMVRILSPS
jgi:hypothetical protein